MCGQTTSSKLVPAAQATMTYTGDQLRKGEAPMGLYQSTIGSRSTVLVLPGGGWGACYDSRLHL